MQGENTIARRQKAKLISIDWVIFNSSSKFSENMKVKYDKITDSLYIVLSNLPIEESEEKKGVILDYSIDGQLIGI